MGSGHMFVVTDVRDPNLLVKLREALSAKYGNNYTVCLSRDLDGRDAIHIKTLLQDLYVVESEIIQVIDGVVVTCYTTNRR